MKFNDLFGSRRNIYITVIIFMALLSAGCFWQYRNIVQEQKLQAQINKEMEQYNDEADGAVGIQVIEDKTEETSIDQAKEVSNTNGSGTAAASAEKDPVKTQGKEVKDTKTTKNEATQAIKMQEPKLETMVIPVFGSVSKDFSDDTLVYSETLDEWTTHLGLDIKTEEGSPVRAAMDGVVSEVKTDPQLGMTIIIDHGSGVFTKYCSLSTLDLVTKGQKVKKGDVISGVGKTALYEIVEDPHLHFEVIKNDKNINPKLYLPKQSMKQ